MTNREWRKKFSIILYNNMQSMEITVPELATLINITPSCIHRYLRCETVPTAIMCVKISNALNCNVCDLIDFKETIK